MEIPISIRYVLATGFIVGEDVGNGSLGIGVGVPVGIGDPSIVGSGSGVGVDRGSPVEATVRSIVEKETRAAKKAIAAPIESVVFYNI